MNRVLIWTKITQLASNTRSIRGNLSLQLPNGAKSKSEREGRYGNSHGRTQIGSTSVEFATGALVTGALVVGFCVVGLRVGVEVVGVAEVGFEVVGLDVNSNM